MYCRPLMGWAHTREGRHLATTSTPDMAWLGTILRECALAGQEPDSKCWSHIIYKLILGMKFNFIPTGWLTGKHTVLQNLKSVSLGHWRVAGLFQMGNTVTSILNLTICTMRHSLPRLFSQWEQSHVKLLLCSEWHMELLWCQASHYNELLLTGHLSSHRLLTARWVDGTLQLLTPFLVWTVSHN